MSHGGSIPLVLCLSGHDPSGGAGLQADIEAIAANGAQACTLVTCLTLQDSCGVLEVRPVDGDWLVRQAELLFTDSRFQAIKIGIIPDLETLKAILAILERHPGIPVVLDPVLAAGGNGTSLTSVSTLDKVRDRLLPRVTLITPNGVEARALVPGEADLPGCAGRLLAWGCRWVLITGGHEPQAEVVNRLYNQDGLVDEMSWPRLPGGFHGSGCTLASAIAAHLGRGETMPTAVRLAQSYTWESLARAFRTGRCQLVPDRFPSLPREIEHD